MLISKLPAFFEEMHPEFAPNELRPGIYEVRLSGWSSRDRDEWVDDPTVDGVFAFGVCDSVEQLLQRCPSLEADPIRQFSVTLLEITRADQPSDGGWRWYKWGEYIGTNQPRHEYLYDEEGIDRVLCFSIHERRADAATVSNAKRAASPAASEAQ